MNKPLRYDVLIVGTGLAGLCIALNLPSQLRIAIISKSSLNQNASAKAQGGIAAVLDPTDSFAEHIADTIVAGAGLCKLDTVQHIVSRAPLAIDWLQQYPIDFTLTNSQDLHLTREGGHSQRRIIHAGDHTGQSVTSVLQSHLQTLTHIDIYEHLHCIDTLTFTNKHKTLCYGINALDTHSGKFLKIHANNTVLATGGLGQLFTHTTNPECATGDGITMAWRAGCQITNLEFIQFHPTALALEGAPSFLISEALRGEGAQLKNTKQHRFMLDYDARAELAPRDIVARAIHQEILKQEGEPVWLDISHKPATFIQAHFPTIYQTVLEYGIDITKEPIPVAPAAHYACGGIPTDVSGRTVVTGLYAVGEVADTGLHGANRLASNSLLECIVIGQNCARALVEDGVHGALNTHIQGTSNEHTKFTHDQLTYTQLDDAEFARTHLPTLTEIQKLMSQRLGIVRSNTSIQLALEQVKIWRNLLKEIYPQDQTLALIELRNQLDCAWLIIQCAKQRRESRGLHYNTDYP